MVPLTFFKKLCLLKYGVFHSVCLCVTEVSVRTKILTSQVNTRKTRGTTFILPKIFLEVQRPLIN